MVVLKLMPLRFQTVECRELTNTRHWQLKATASGTPPKLILEDDRKLGRVTSMASYG